MNRNEPRRKKWPRKTLADLVDFIEDRHGGSVTTAAIAEKIGTTAKNVTNIFRKDDMLLSRAEQIADCYGYVLHIMYPKRDEIFTSSAPVRLKEFDNAGNLSGLVQYLRDMKITIGNLSKRVDITSATMNRYFTKGDMPLSVLERITDNLHIEPRWEFVPNPKKKNS